MFERAQKQHPQSIELKLRIVDELVTLERYQDAEGLMLSIQKDAPNDWRLAWIRGRALLNQGKLNETVAAFDALASDFPGELAPQHALGLAFEAAGQVDLAMRFYDSVSRADNSFASAALRLGACLEGKGDLDGAIAAYKRVTASSSRYPVAQMAVARLLIRKAETLRSVDDALAAGASLEAIEAMVDSLDCRQLRADVLAKAATIAGEVAQNSAAPAMILGTLFEEPALREAAESEYRKCARRVESEDARIRFVDLANSVRRVTWF
jgi:serine/threonine-protein kinase PknG